MANTKISQLTAYTGSASGSFLVMNDSTETTTYKITRENLLNGYTSSLAISSSQAISASNSHLLDGYHSSAFPRLSITNTFTADQQVLISGNYEIGTFEGDTFFILDNVSGSEIGLSNKLSHFDGPNDIAGIYISSGSNLAYVTAIEIPNGPDFIMPDGLIRIKMPTQITGSLVVSNGITGSLQGTASNTLTLNGTGSTGFISNVTDTYTSTPAITNIISLTQAEYNTISASASSNTLYIII